MRDAQRLSGRLDEIFTFCFGRKTNTAVCAFTIDSQSTSECTCYWGRAPCITVYLYSLETTIALLIQIFGPINIKQVAATTQSAEMSNSTQREENDETNSPSALEQGGRSTHVEGSSLHATQPPAGLSDRRTERAHYHSPGNLLARALSPPGGSSAPGRTTEQPANHNNNNTRRSNQSEGNLRTVLFNARRRNAISQPRRRERIGEGHQTAARRRHELLVRLDHEASQSERRCMADGDHIRDEEDREDKVELHGEEAVEPNFEGKLALENMWM